MTHSPVFYYPVPVEGDTEVQIFYAYETEKGHGVTVLIDAPTQEATAFADLAEATVFCRYLNARQHALPRWLPPVALRFLLAGAGRPRSHDLHGRRFLVLSQRGTTEVQHAR